MKGYGDYIEGSGRVLMRDAGGLLIVLNGYSGSNLADEYRRFRDEILFADLEIVSTRIDKIGDLLKKHFAGWRAYFFTADWRLAKLIGLATSSRTPLFNGPLDCRLFEFKMVSGTLRKAPRLTQSRADAEKTEA